MTISKSDVQKKCTDFYLRSVRAYAYDIFALFIILIRSYDTIPCLQGYLVLVRGKYRVGYADTYQSPLFGIYKYVKYWKRNYWNLRIVRTVLQSCVCDSNGELPAGLVLVLLLYGGFYVTSILRTSVTGADSKTFWLDRLKKSTHRFR